MEKILDLAPKIEEKWAFIVEGTGEACIWAGDWAQLIENEEIYILDFLDKDNANRCTNHTTIQSPNIYDSGVLRKPLFRSAVVILNERPEGEFLNLLVELTKKFFNEKEFKSYYPKPEYVGYSWQRVRIVSAY